MVKLFLRIIFWTFSVILLSIFVPTLFTDQFPVFFDALSFYSDFLLEFHLKSSATNSLFSLILLLNVSLFSIALFMVMLNNFGANGLENSFSPHNVDKRSSNLRFGERGVSKSPAYLGYSLDAYNRSIESIFDAKRNHVVDLIGFSTLVGSVFSGVSVINSIVDMVAHDLKFSWIVGMPHLMLQNIGFLSFKKDDFILNEERVLEKLDELRDKHIIFVLPTKGGNFNTVRASVESVAFWKETFEMKCGRAVKISQWVVCEQDDYERSRTMYDELSSISGLRIIVVPRDFSPVMGTKFKARALSYALKVMSDEEYTNENVWIYHQDDETKIGEDTLLGIMDYIANAGPDDIYAAGIIIYSDGLTYSPPRVQEPARSYDDFRILFTTKTRGILSFGHHGSHLLVRADVEGRIGWDFGDARTEDWIFGLMLWQKYRPGRTILKGFGYEKPPLSADDLLKQRRRWAHGALQILRRKDIKLRYRLAALYGMASWFSALPSLIAFILSLIHPTGGLFLGSGFIAGFTWLSLYRYYSYGYILNDRYITRESGHRVLRKVKKTLALIGGMIIESIAPWSALFKPPKGFEVISKDEK